MQCVCVGYYDDDRGFVVPLQSIGKNIQDILEALENGQLVSISFRKVDTAGGCSAKLPLFDVDTQKAKVK